MARAAPPVKRGTRPFGLGVRSPPTDPSPGEDMASTNTAAAMTERIAAMQDFKLYRELSWEGSFEDYLQIVRERPQVTRNAYQRIYDMIISYGTEEYIDNKKKLVRYNFFKDERNGGANAIYGLDIPLMRLVHVLKAAAEGYGPEKRVILLHGPVGSSKSTIARLLKQGLEQLLAHARRRALHLRLGRTSATWGSRARESERFPSPMNEEPLRLIPAGVAPQGRSTSSACPTTQFKVRVDGDLDPASRFIFNRLMNKYGGDWSKVMHARARQAARPVGEGPRRHRHLPAQGREEPGLDRAHRRHQLPQDRRVRLATPTRARSTSTASSTSPTAASSSSSRCSSSTSPSSTTCSARRRSTRSSPRSSPRPTSTRSSSATPTRPSTRSS